MSLLALMEIEAFAELMTPSPTLLSLGTDKRKRFRPIECAKQETAATRPNRYTDAEWLAAIADARRLGYPPKEDGR